MSARDRPSSCCTGGRTTSTRSRTSCRSSSRRTIAWSCRSCAASAPPDSGRLPRHVTASRRRSPLTCRADGRIAHRARGRRRLRLGRTRRELRRRATFDDTTFERTAAAFANPDHVDIVIHNYRWRLGLADGERAYDALEERLERRPVIGVPSITIGSDFDGAAIIDIARS